MSEHDKKPVIVGVDGSDAAQLALKTAARQASLTGVPLQVIATWMWPSSYGYGMAYAGDFNPEADAKQVVDDMVKPLRAEYPDLEISAHAVEGEARDVLVHRSRTASLLVVGSRGHGGLTGMLLGSVSGYCVSHSHCPTLVVR